jgi:arsenate reductase
VRNVLFLCTGNSARSILAEVLLNELGTGRYRAYSAGSRPSGTVNPGALEKLAAEGHATAGLESKSWDRFSSEEAPEFDIVITVCDNAAGESCPIWNGAPVTAHWGIPDPAYFDDQEALETAFDLAYVRLRRRIEKMLALPGDLEGADLQRALSGVHQQARAEDIAGA